jgi:phosphoribosylaminoimidazolecarboxamide formyltransferase / IMP cyclohydrolase
MGDLVPVRRALLSVTDKTGLVAFATALASRGVEIISTGGTASALRDAGLKVTMIDQVTGFPEIMGGRVKTLHPKVHGGLLGVRDDPGHREAMEKHGIAPIDLVCVNLYAFEQTVAKPGVSEHDAIENIDIGGPSMLRSAAKNFEWVTVVTSPSQYERVLHELSLNNGATTRQTRAELAAEVFAITSRYDAAIAAYLKWRPSMLFPALLSMQFVKDEDLRYGENPHQAAALYRAMRHGAEARWPSIASAEQLHGKELSYNNINDAVAALELVVALNRTMGAASGPEGLVSAAIVKHTNPCGAALGASCRDAIDQAIAGDPMAAYGGILAVGDELDGEAAERLQSKEVFLEVIIAPRFSAGALDALRKRWANVRLLAVGDLDPALDTHSAQLEHRSVPGGLLVQQRDLAFVNPGEYQHKAGPKPTGEQLSAGAFLESVCRFLFSNAVCLGGSVGGGGGKGVKPVRLFGAGAGQMDRVTSCRLAVEKAGKLARGAVAFSDAFFPFPDGPQVLIDAGVSCIVHPGGSKRDEDTFKLCEERGVTCLTTGVRHFRH